MTKEEILAVLLLAMYPFHRFQSVMAQKWAFTVYFAHQHLFILYMYVFAFYVFISKILAVLLSSNNYFRRKSKPSIFNFSIFSF